MTFVIFYLHLKQLYVNIKFMALKKDIFEDVIKANFKDVKFILTDMVGNEEHYSL